MPLQTGARLGPYEIKAAIGAGGMGEVLYEMLTAAIDAEPGYGEPPVARPC